MHKTRNVIVGAAITIGLGLLGACSGTTQSSSTAATAPDSRAGSTGAHPAPTTAGARVGTTSSDQVISSSSTTSSSTGQNETIVTRTLLPPGTPKPGQTIPTTLPPLLPGEFDCGIVYLATGWPTTPVPSPSLYSCLKTGWTAGTPTRLVERAQTDGLGGAILVTTYDVTGPGSLRVTEDATNAADRPQRITVSTCTGLTVGMTDVKTSGCTPA